MSEKTTRHKDESWLTTGTPASTALVENLPPSSKLVLCYLRDHSQCTKTEAAANLCLPTSTTEEAIAMLKDESLVKAQPSVSDARVTVYTLTENITEADVEHAIVA